MSETVGRAWFSVTERVLSDCLHLPDNARVIDIELIVGCCSPQFIVTVESPDLPPGYALPECSPVYEHIVASTTIIDWGLPDKPWGGRDMTEDKQASDTGQSCDNCIHRVVCRYVDNLSKDALLAGILNSEIRGDMLKALAAECGQYRRDECQP